MLYKIHDGLWLNLSDVQIVMFGEDNSFRIMFKYTKDLTISETNSPDSCARLKEILQKNYDYLMLPKK